MRVNERRAFGRLVIVVMGAIVAAAGCGEDTTDGSATDTTDTADTSVASETTSAPSDTLEDTTSAPPDGDADASLPETIAPGELGAPCTGNLDCFSGFCVEGPEGFVCTRRCDEQCPPGWDCKGVATRTDLIFLCQPRIDRLCAPCTADLQCNGGACLVIDGEERCARPCARDEDCPGGFGCVPDGEAGNDGHCQPATGSCTCYDERDEGLRTCTTTNEHGTCFGVASCDPELGWSACGARTPAAETCNGLDDDCDAFVDEDLDEVGQACVIEVAGVGSCDGTRVCAGLAGLQCQGPSPAAEACNFADDDCDDAVDEDFKQGDVYASFEHCGTCNRSCAIGFPNAEQTTCQVDQGVAQCVVVSCRDGYIKQNDFQCIPDAVNLCEPCADDDNCLGQGSACVTLSDGRFCAKACAGAGDCPLGFACTEVGEPARQCVPTTGVCSCGPGTQGLSRACSVTVSPAGQPSYTCAGSETCGAAGWGACAMPTETCNGVDDDCDAVTDEGFRNGQGRYDRVEHCGACGVSCLALDYPNSSPICDATGAGLPRCGYDCDGAWVDVDAAPGCDCLPTSTSDLPDVAGVDANCDGIDGEIVKSVFVSKTGDDAGLGTIDDPLRTISAGITKATQLGRRDVLVATGVYEESVALANGVSVYGGYAPSFLERAIDVHETAILGADPTDARRGAVNAIGVATTAGQAIVFDGFSVFGADNPAPSGNSYAVYLRNVGPHLTVSNNYLVAGNGGAGGAGGKGSDGLAGVDGVAGIGAETTGSTCDASDHAAGGAGGVRMCGGTDISGGAGGTRKCPVAPSPVQTSPQTPTAAEYGVAGKNTGGNGGEAGYHDRIQNAACDVVSSSSTHDTFGGVGGDGDDGTAGVPGTACSSGAGMLAVDGHWASSQAGSANAGGHGSGGGGGGAAGGIDHNSSCTSRPYVVGGSGGGGGSGGCRGEIGGAGASGGGSFVVFLAYASAPSALPAIRDNTLVRGRGGVGGAGGAGGVGGAGGFGADGGSQNRGTGGFPQSCCASGGGAGGNGGRGGHGPGGAGGCGGASYGVWLAPIASAVSKAPITSNTIPSAGGGGAGGAGGTSLGNVGPSGGAGASGATSY
ncbi:MAG: hypothetical protein IT385_01985 [Deltaproteobacteria bacterium]|nr:hypothetical protein [Deltaproteobacteria bacterium]